MTFPRTTVREGGNPAFLLRNVMQSGTPAFAGVTESGDYFGISAQ